MPLVMPTKGETDGNLLSGCGSAWLERCVRDAKVGGSNPLTPTIFLPEWAKNMKPEKASLHGTQCRFIRCSRASCTAGALHIFAFSDEAAPFHSAMKHCSVSLHNMKHSAFAPYYEKMKNESPSVCNTTMSVLYYHQEGITHHGKILK